MLRASHSHEGCVPLWCTACIEVLLWKEVFTEQPVWHLLGDVRSERAASYLSAGTLPAQLAAEINPRCCDEAT